MKNEHIGSKFDSWLKDENIEIREDEVRKNTLKYGFTCLNNKGKIIPNYKIFQIGDDLIIDESEVEE